MSLVIDRRPVHDTLADDVREGLARPLKQLPPKLFYDERGSELFDRITSLPEYYPTRCERSILNRRAPEIVRSSRAEELVELGSGVASKTRALLYAMAGNGMLRRYVPFDVDVDEANSWIEMRLRANGAQRVRIHGADLELTFADGEEIRTEISAKFTREAVQRELLAAGLRLDDFFTDGAGLFGLAFASPAR